jgi:serine/threonine protein kinase
VALHHCRPYRCLRAPVTSARGIEGKLAHERQRRVRAKYMSMVRKKKVVVEMSTPDGPSGQDALAQAASGSLTPGMVVGGIYRAIRLVGVGGMGEVWEARHERTKGRVALKLLLSEMGRHQEVLLRFQREVEITSGLNHPNIVRVSDADKLPDGRPYLIMEFLEGHDLTHVIGKPMPVSEATEIIEQAAMGLHAAHGQSIIHRDLKPANIFLVPLPGTSRSLVKILDFGISKAVDGLSKLTQTRTVMGTPYYMAPEQATGGGSVMDARADQFSLAAIAYELLTGRMAFEGDGMVNILYRVVHEAPPTFASLGVAAGPAVEAVVLRGLSKSPNDRFGTVLEFSDALKRAGQLAVVAPRPKAAAPVRPTSLLPTGRVATTTLSASTGEMEAVGGDSQDEFEVLSAVKSPRRKAVALLSGVAVLAVAVLAIVILRGSPAGNKSSPTSGGPSVSFVPPVAPAPLPSPLPPASHAEPVAAEPIAAPVAEPLPQPTKPRASTKSTHDHQGSPRIPKTVAGKPRLHPGPLNDTL